MSRSRTPRFLAVLALLGLVSLLVAGPAAASISGPCTASIAGEDVTGRDTGPTSDPIVVHEDTSVPVSMAAKTPITHLKIEIGFGPFSWTVHDKPSHGTSWKHDVAVDKYATYGVGLYKVSGSSSGPGLSCTGDALVRVKGNPFTSLAGIGGVVAGGGGLIGLIALALRGRRGRGSRPVLAVLDGVLTALGFLLLLQQAGRIYPTLPLTLLFVTIGIVLGAGVAWLRHLLGTSAGTPASAT
jgi:hypothetical protein